MVTGQHDKHKVLDINNAMENPPGSIDYHRVGMSPLSHCTHMTLGELANTLRLCLKEVVTASTSNTMNNTNNVLFHYSICNGHFSEAKLRGLVCKIGCG